MKDLIERLRKWAAELGPYDSDSSNDLSAAAQQLENLSGALEFATNDAEEWAKAIHPIKWIPVEERLPEPTTHAGGDEFVSVIVAVAGGLVTEALFSRTMESWDYLGLIDAPKPTHWMKLPEPPNGD